LTGNKKIWQIFDSYSENPLKTSSSGVAEFNGDVRISTGSSEIAVSAHAQWKYGQSTGRFQPIAKGYLSATNNVLPLAALHLQVAIG